MDVWSDGVRLEATIVALAVAPVLSQLFKRVKHSDRRVKNLIPGRSRRVEALKDLRSPIRQFGPPDVGSYGGRCAGCFPIIH